MTLTCIKKLSFKTQKTDIRAQKIDESSLATYKIVITEFQISDKLDKAYFFQKTFLLIDTSIDIILGMLF